MDKIREKLENNKKYVDEVLDNHNAGTGEKVLKFMLKGPDQGTLETLKVQLHKISKSFPDVKLLMLSSSVGSVSEGDVRCALHFKCMLFTMDVPISNEVLNLARKEKVTIKSSRLIFGLTDEVKDLLKKENDNYEANQTMKGTAEVGNVFEIKVSKSGRIFILKLRWKGFNEKIVKKNEFFKKTKKIFKKFPKFRKKKNFHLFFFSFSLFFLKESKQNLEF